MSHEQKKILSAVRREHAEDYILTSLVAFGATVIFTRAFLHVTGYPQLGNDVLHIAHALWGGLLLIVAAFMPLAFANRWVLQVSALLGGIGIGLFMDEVGKFITQANDYFYPPALPLIYGFILLNVFVYLYFRRPHKADPRVALYHAFDRLMDALDGDLDTAEAAQVKKHLEIAKGSQRSEILSLVDLLSDYFEMEKEHLEAPEPNLWKRFARSVDSVGMRIGRRNLRWVISLLLIGWILFIAGYLFLIGFGFPDIDPIVTQWRTLLIGIQAIIGVLMVIAAWYWLSGKEARGLRFAIIGLLFSLIALQTLYFYITQFSAITATLLQLAFLGLFVLYRRLFLVN
jgi:hypothetical protein